jgi:hypothetical protein
MYFIRDAYTKLIFVESLENLDLLFSKMKWLKNNKM